MPRVFLIVLDSFGCGEMPDSAKFNDINVNTLKSVSCQKEFIAPNLRKLGIFNLDGLGFETKEKNVLGSYAKLRELSMGKDTTIGHWEMAGIVSSQPFPTYPNGFPDYIIKELEAQLGRKIICNKPYSGTQVINDYGDEHVKTGALIVYTSADSVLQIAAHEDVVPLKVLYKYCEIVRRVMTGKDAVGRIIARPFVGENGHYTRTPNRHDFSLLPTKQTMLNILQESGYDVIAVGKISDIFAKSGIDVSYTTKSNNEGMSKALEMQNRDFNGICFVNLVDGDMVYGHRRDAHGYAQMITDFDIQLGEFLKNMKKEDVLMITADHGCDPLYTASTDHTREYVPLLIVGNMIKKMNNLGVIDGLDCISATILDLFKTEERTSGESLLYRVIKK